LTPARIVSNARGGESVSVADIEEVDALFFDAKRSAKLLQEQQGKYLA
tara:strand:- start:2302 stop:2445 length:144 start_codon:yes stop_codon:yes gene_type:complete